MVPHIRKVLPYDYQRSAYLVGISAEVLLSISSFKEYKLGGALQSMICRTCLISFI